jgi:hypothetical protein
MSAYMATVANGYKDIAVVWIRISAYKFYFFDY